MSKYQGIETMRAETDIQKLQRAIEEKRYRDAQELLETGDIEPEVADKWLRWLADLYREEWQQAGFASEKKSAALPQITTLPFAVGMAAVVIMLLLLMGVSIGVFSVPNIIFQASVSLTAIILGTIGWQRAGVLFYPDHGRELGVFIWFTLAVYLVWTKVAGVFADAPQFQDAIVVILLSSPLVIELSWYLGNKIGAEIEKRRVIKRNKLHAK